MAITLERIDQLATGAPALTDWAPTTPTGGPSVKAAWSTILALLSSSPVTGDIPKWNASGILVDSGLVPANMVQGAVARLTADVTNNTATLASLTDLTVTLAAGKSYLGYMVVKCINSQTTEGIQFDFGGGSLTATSFWASTFQLAGGTNVLGTAIGTTLTTPLTFTTITGESVLEFTFAISVNAGGTLIPRFAEASHAAGTATARLGSNIQLTLSSN